MYVGRSKYLRVAGCRNIIALHYATASCLPMKRLFLSSVLILSFNLSAAAPSSVPVRTEINALLTEQFLWQGVPSQVWRRIAGGQPTVAHRAAQSDSQFRRKRQAMTGDGSLTAGSRA
jgi:hypothetical protein